MEIWAIIGMVLVATVVFFVLMGTMFKTLTAMKVTGNWVGMLIVLASNVYVAYITWAITSGNIPFLSGG